MDNLPKFAKDFFKRLDSEGLPLIDKHTVLFHCIQNDEGKRDRTGVLYKIAGHHFILTASHDLRFIIDNQIPMYIDCNDQHTDPIQISNSGTIFHFTEEEGRDVAAIKLSSDIIDQLPESKEFLTHNRIKLFDYDKKSLYILFGYPRAWSSIDEDKKFISEPLVYACELYQGKKDPIAHYIKDVHITLQFNQKATSIHDLSSFNLPKIHGVSGCGIWKVAEWSAKAFQNWNPKQIHLVALQHRWFPQEKYIQGTWINYVMDLIRVNYPDVTAAMKLFYRR